MDIIKKPVFRVGKAQDGREITEKQIKQIYETTKKLLDDGYKIPIKLGHNDTTQEAKGWAYNIVLENNVIYFDLKEMDVDVLEKYNSEKLPFVSVEIFRDIFWKDEKYNSVISAIALLGVDQPALTFNANKEFSMCFEHIKINDVKDKIMSDNIEKFSNEIKELKDLYKMQTSEIEKFKVEISEKDKIIDKYKSTIDEINKKEFETKKLKLIEKFESEVIAKGRLAPAEKQKIIETFEALEFDVEKCEKIISAYASLPEGVLTQEFATKTENKEVFKTSKFDEQMGLTPDDYEKFGN